MIGMKEYTDTLENRKEIQEALKWKTEQRNKVAVKETKGKWMIETTKCGEALYIIILILLR